MIKPTRLVPALAIAVALFAGRASADPLTLSFTANDVKSVMAGYGDHLSNGTYQWGLWSIRAMPIVTGGTYEIEGGSVVGVPGDWWAFEAPAAYGWAAPYTSDLAYFYARPGSEHYRVDAHPLYLIADQRTDSFQSYRFDNTVQAPAGSGRSAYVGVCDGTIASQLAGCNPTVVMSGETRFTFDVLLGSGATLLGWQFLVDGSKYFRPEMGPTDPSQSRWVADFIGGDGSLDASLYGSAGAGGGLAYNVGAGYQVMMPVPEPGTLALLALGLAGARAATRRRPRR